MTNASREHDISRQVHHGFIEAHLVGSCWFRHYKLAFTSDADLNGPG